MYKAFRVYGALNLCTENNSYNTDLIGANPQRVSTDIIIEIKQLYSGRMA